MPPPEEPSAAPVELLDAPAAAWRAEVPLPPIAVEFARRVPRARNRRPRRFGRSLLRGAQALSLAALAYLCLFNLSVVRGSSMAPGIHDGDRILIDHLAYCFRGVGRGEVVVLKYPLDPSIDYIKRVIGLPGDRILMRDGRVWINGTEVEEPYVAEVDRTARVDLVVKPAHFFVLGDNRPRSCDSREFGLVPQDYVRGKVALRVWPPARAGWIDGEVHAAR